MISEMASMLCEMAAVKSPTGVFFCDGFDIFGVGNRKTASNLLDMAIATWLCDF